MDELYWNEEISIYKTFGVSSRTSYYNERHRKNKNYCKDNCRDSTKFNKWVRLFARGVNVFYTNRAIIEHKCVKYRLKNTRLLERSVAMKKGPIGVTL